MTFRFFRTFSLNVLRSCILEAEVVEAKDGEVSNGFLFPAKVGSVDKEQFRNCDLL